MASASQDHYEVLGLLRSATAAEVKAAYRSAARSMHPDLAPNEADKKVRSAAFRNVQQAYDVLSDPEKRRIYDATGTTDKPGASPSGAAWVDPLGPMREAAQRVRDNVVKESNQILEQAGHQAVAEAEALCTDLVRAGADALRDKIFGRRRPPAPRSGTALVRRPGPSRKPR